MENSMKFSQKPNNRTTMKGKSGVLVTQLFLTLCDPVGCSLPESSVHGVLLGENTEVGSHSLLQDIFLTQGLNLGLLHYKQNLYHLSHQGSPRTTMMLLLSRFSRVRLCATP